MHASGGSDAGSVFVTGFSRGGTTLLMNLLASHPELCTVGEVHQLFKGSNVRDRPWQVAWKALTRDLPTIVSSGQDLLSPRRWQPRGPVPRFTLRHIDRVLAASKRRSHHDHLNRYKEPGERYSPEEVDRARLLGKTLDGTVQLSDTLRAVDSACHFVGLVRHGFAVCEGHVRRGRAAADAGRLYQSVIDRMLADASGDPRYQIVRFETLVAQTWTTMQSVFRGLGLEPSAVRYVRLQHRRRMNQAGEHKLDGDREWEVRWLAIRELDQVVDPEIDDHQIRLLSASDREAFLREAGDAMERLGYRHGAARISP